jgi:hypothetical protein
VAAAAVNDRLMLPDVMCCTFDELLARLVVDCGQQHPEFL